MFFDWPVMRFIQLHMKCGVMDFIMPKLTMLGNLGAIWFIAAAVLVCIKQYRRQGLVLLAALAAGAVIGNAAIKNIVMRPRPCWIDPPALMLIPVPMDYSFPSGHSLAGFIGASVLFMTRRLWGIIAFIIAAIIAFSRIYLFVHFPTDVLAGIALGLVIGFSACHIGGITDNKTSEELNKPDRKIFNCK